MNMDIISPNYQSIRNRAKEELKKIENKGVSKAETLEDLRDTKGKSFRTADLEKLMEKYDPEAYAQYSKFAKSADGARTQGGLAFLSNWMDKVKKGLKNGSISSDSNSNTIKKAAQTDNTTRKTAVDELAYLSKKYSNYSFLAASYSKGMRYGSNSTVNVAIDPRFLEKMANDPELEKEYEKQIAAMQACDEQMYQSEAASGWRVDAKGWAIDKDGGISGWVIVSKDSNAKSYLQTMSENAEKIRRQNEEKKQEKVKLEEKRQASREEKESNAIKKAVETGSSTRKTAVDELSYLSKKYSNYSFLAANYSKGMRYGSMATTNIAISPEFLKKMANSPELEKEYESYFEGMRKLDEENIRTHEARGRRMVAQGWAIDKDGGISRWGISEPTDKRHHGQEMTDYANKIRKQKLEKKREQAKLEEKRRADREEKEKLQEKLDEAGKEKFGVQWKGAVVIDMEEGTAAVIREANKNKEGAVGVNLDRKA